MTKDIHNYDDIIDMEHYVSKNHTPMGLYDRAAQFSSFAALKGHNDAISETARLTESKIFMSEDEKVLLDKKLRIVIDNIELSRSVNIVYFVPDSKKNGGRYVQRECVVKKYNSFENTLVLTDDTVIPISDITDIMSDLLSEYNFI